MVTKQQLNNVLRHSIFSILCLFMMIACRTSFIIAPESEKKGNAIIFTNNTNGDKIKVIGFRDSTQAYYEKYGSVMGFYIRTNSDIKIMDLISVDTILKNIMNGFDSLFIIRNDTLRLEYHGCKISSLGDSLHCIYNVDAWENDFYIYRNDTFNILRFTFVEEDFNSRDSIAIPIYNVWDKIRQ